MARVLFFGRLRDVAGTHAIDVEAETVSALRSALAQQNSALAEALEARGISKSFGSVQALTDVDFDRPSACPEFDTSFGTLKAGDWDCDDNQDGGDIIAALLSLAALPLPPDYPVSCPEPGQFVPAGPS